MSNSQTKKYDGKLVTTTLASMHMQTANYLGLPMTYAEKSTLNEHLQINRETLPDPMARPVAKYLSIGNGAHTTITINGLPPIPVPVRHQPTDAAPYGIQPLVLRPVNNDLSDDMRAMYALRRLEEHDGQRYWAYYLKRLDLRSSVVTDYYTKVVDGKKTTIPFEYSDENLFPTPSDLPDYDFETTDKVIPLDGDYTNAAAPVLVTFTEFDVQEYLNVAKILFNNPMAAAISEICICSGVDGVATGESFTGSPFNYEEAFGVQVAVFLSTYVNLAMDNDGVTYRIQVGQASPMTVAPKQIPNYNMPTSHQSLVL